MPRRAGSGQRPDLHHELSLLSAGASLVAGVDEAGRGALAGPVVAAAVVLPLDRFDLLRALEQVRDSKMLTPQMRQSCQARIQALAISTGIGLAEAHEIDLLGLLPATRLAMHRAVEALQLQPSHLLIDHLKLPELAIPQTAVTRGDAKVLSISAASILAKVARDRMLVALDRQYPGYGFARHKGYGTAEHRAALGRIGPSEAHRRSYAPVAAHLDASSRGG